MVCPNASSMVMSAPKMKGSRIKGNVLLTIDNKDDIHEENPINILREALTLIRFGLIEGSKK